MSETPVESALAHAASELRRRKQPFALIGGLGVSIRGEVRFTRNVDIAIAVARDDEVEKLVHDLAARGYSAVALVEHEARGRIATARLESPNGVIVSLRTASSGTEPFVVEPRVCFSVVCHECDLIFP